VALGAVYQLGLLLLMFSAGAEVRRVFQRGERRTSTFITVAGTLVPFAVGLAVLQLLDLSRFHGAADSDTAFLLVFAIAMAVTSIPVISRIMFDLGILGTPFARIVLSAAVLEDIPLYVLLAIALGLAHAAGGDVFGLPALLGLEAGGRGAVTYHVLATLVFFGAFLAFGTRAYLVVAGLRCNLVNRGNPIAFQLVFMLLVTGCCTLMGVPPLFGAFVAGMAVSTATEDPDNARAAIKSFSFAFFVPVYFAIVGLKLDLVNEFDPLFFLMFLALACGVKALSVYAGARLAGEGPGGARNLAVAMNARGGPGIVLASVALDAGIVNGNFYTSLVLLAILTSMLAGSWLERVVRSGRPLREPAAAPVPAPALSGVLEPEPAGGRIAPG
jgi:Kef-type K+ transport system membrane component KefB